MSDNHLWKCPHCGTTNSDAVCRVCHYVLPGANMMPVQTETDNKNKKLIIILSAVGSVLLVLLIVLLIFFLSQREPEKEVVEPEVVPVAETQEDVLEAGDYFVNAFDDSGIYVRKEPTKSSKQILHIKKGDQKTKLEYLGEKEKGDDGWFWYNVKIPNGKKGYVREDVVVEWEGND